LLLLKVVIQTGVYDRAKVISLSPAGIQLKRISNPREEAQEGTYAFDHRTATTTCPRKDFGPAVKAVVPYGGKNKHSSYLSSNPTRKDVGPAEKAAVPGGAGKKHHSSYLSSKQEEEEVHVLAPYRYRFSKPRSIEKN
jgi:hypothetical protein